ncbi:PREDICTED: ubiquitin-fold modifier-conjugating enzyme 1-like [Tarenaya hassleriana]|uniref:ubiquitin-fold modifier-conjugating enzyme 1-like n=1 Tax=Tarenaya hassleriana TaxID=28532 RepID=UPI00053C382B|nr:PREDICTED: ubiquitin-fold modifier-conjugating enzyme 1-like [Tarenaya hassleriana]
MEGWDPSTKSTLTQILLLTTKAGPRDGQAWTQRLKEEYKSLIAYTQMNKSNDNNWFHISASNLEGTRWTGKCWYVHNLLKYEFDLQFDIPVTYPATALKLELPDIDGKTHKIVRFGMLERTIHVRRRPSVLLGVTFVDADCEHYPSSFDIIIEKYRNYENT